MKFKGVTHFMYMAQLCVIAARHGLTRVKACNAFGGDKGKHQVITHRKARIWNNRKYVLIRAAI
jgi:hypothetical protein